MGFKKLDFNTEDFNSLKISELKRITDYWFRIYLCKKSKRKGEKIWCPFSNSYKTIDKMHVCHYIDRARMCTRWDENNCIMGSSDSNMFESKINHKESRSLHHYKFEQILGNKKVENLLEKSKKICIIERRDYIKIIKKFKNGQ